MQQTQLSSVVMRVCHARVSCWQFHCETLLVVMAATGERNPRPLLGCAPREHTPHGHGHVSAHLDRTCHTHNWVASDHCSHVWTTPRARAPRLGPCGRASARRGGDAIGHEAVELGLPLRQPRRPVGKEGAAALLLALAQLARVPALAVRRVVARVALPVGLGLLGGHVRRRERRGQHAPGMRSRVAAWMRRGCSLGTQGCSCERRGARGSCTHVYETARKEGRGSGGGAAEWARSERHSTTSPGMRIGWCAHGVCMAACLHGDAEGREAGSAHHVELIVSERHPVRSAAPGGLCELLVQRVRARPAEEARVVLLLVDQACRRLDVLQPGLGVALVEVLAARQARLAAHEGLPAVARVARARGAGRRSEEGEALLGGVGVRVRVRLGRAIERLEDARRKLLTQLAEDPAGRVRLDHVRVRVRVGVRVRVRVGVGVGAARLAGVPALGFVTHEAGREGRDVTPHALELRSALLTVQHAAQHDVAVRAQLVAHQPPQLGLGRQARQERVMPPHRPLRRHTRHAHLCRARLGRLRALRARRRRGAFIPHLGHRGLLLLHGDAVALGVDLEDVLGIKRDAAAAHRVDCLARDVDAQHGLGLERDAVDPTCLGVAGLPDLDALVGGRVDAQHAVGVRGDAVDPAVGPEHATEVLVLAVVAVVARVAEGQGHDLLRHRVDLEHGVRIGGDAVDAAVRPRDAAVPLPAASGQRADGAHLLPLGVDLDHRHGALRDAVDAAVTAEQPAVPLVLARGRRPGEGPAEGGHCLRRGVDHEDRLGKLRDAVDAAIVRAEDAAVPLPLPRYGVADLGAHALARRAVDLQHLVRVARDAVDAPVRSCGASEPLVLAWVGAADQRHLGGDRVQLEHVLRVPRHTVDAAISTEDAAEPLVLTG
eukprot:scaffold14458_cov66-Phaeocystis_antarctica.AAC.2